MCLYPKLIKNRKYTVTKKNGGDVPKCTDARTLYVPVGCGKCMECMKQRARQWQVRLLEEIKDYGKNEKHFVTLTFSNESIRELTKEVQGNPEGYELDNAIATLAVRRFLERWRAEHGKSVKHWFTTELGHNGTEHIHLHGIIFTKNREDIGKLWQYGHIWAGTYVNEATVNYVIKYCTKVDIQNPYYKAKILASPGIGKRYINTLNAELNKYKPGATREAYVNRNGCKINLPVYYRNHLYTEQEREKLWIEKLDKQERWVDGSKVSIKDGLDNYFKTLQHARAKNARLGYGNDQINWQQRNYENQLRQMKIEQRIQNSLNNEPQENTRPDD